MLLDPALLAVFIVAVLVICVTPGPDMLYILATSVSQGIRAGLVASVGMSLGMLVHTVLVAVGLAAVMSAVPVLFDVIRYAGAAYLLYIGIRAWLDSSSAAAIEQRPPVPLRTVLWRATMTNLLNPKIVLFYLAFLPQFVAPDLGTPGLQLFLLGMIFVVIGLIIDSLIAVGAGRLGEWLQGRRGLGRLLDRIAGTVFVALAARLVIA
ncbi:LysE family translocator [Actinoplanes hulinensis]|uniref:LysE family translocator n=1 Tax=Actinoplanes hulinensis TaxID=1144547 RepID=A0ABS7B4P3_9ACTN|nr:LysE family translocator [Actinoplanes hulinensis]MBW6435948.1 LysE family translocator [Actinoplanes hulinensis]